MKFLLTSEGITNASIAQALVDLVGLPASEIKVAFIPTAADLYPEDKRWLIEDMAELVAQKYAQVDVVPIAAMTKEQSLPRLESAHVICFGGGSEFRLAKVLRETGLEKELPRLLETRVYMGISGGSMIAGLFLEKSFIDWVYEDDQEEAVEAPLGFVDCFIISHLNKSFMKRVRKETFGQFRGKLAYPLYLLDDDSALKVVDGKIEVVTEGEVIKM